MSDQAPPHDEAAEQIVLGAMMENAEVIEAVAGVGISADAFYLPAHATIYSQIIRARAAGDPTEEVALAHQLNAAGELSRVGGTPYLHTLMRSVPTVANAPYYAGIVLNHAARRDVIKGGLQLQQIGEIDDDERRTAEVDKVAAALSGGARRAGRRASPLDWPSFLAEDFGEVKWLPGKLMARGQQMALVAEAKSGKSLLCLEWAWRAACGSPFLGDVSRAPMRVLYVDQENDHGEIQARLHALGATSEDLASLTYLSFPAFRPLNTAIGSRDLLHAVRECRAELVFLDTISRMVVGTEKDAEPWLDMYRLTMLPLKRQGVSSIRLDHFGKDSSLGARGSSAKNADVDHVWELREAERGGSLIRLSRSHSRSGIGDGSLVVRRRGARDGDGRWKPGETQHTLDATEDGAPVGPWLLADGIAKKLNDAGVSWNVGRDKTREACVRLGIAARNEMLSEVVRIRKGGHGE